MEALLEGWLVERGGCMGLDRDGGGFVELVWHEDDVQWRAAEGAVVFQGTSIALGESVALGGGNVTSPAYTRRPAACTGTGGGFLVGCLPG